MLISLWESSGIFFILSRCFPQSLRLKLKCKCWWVLLGKSDPCRILPWPVIRLHRGSVMLRVMLLRLLPQHRGRILGQLSRLLIWWTEDCQYLTGYSGSALRRLSSLLMVRNSQGTEWLVLFFFMQLLQLGPPKQINLIQLNEKTYVSAGSPDAVSCCVHMESGRRKTGCHLSGWEQDDKIWWGWQRITATKQQ